MDKSQQELNDRYRNGGNPIEDAERVIDCVTYQKRLEHGVEGLRNDLAVMGWFDDEMPMPWENWEPVSCCGSSLSMLE